jgi:hypothetical protein
MVIQRVKQKLPVRFVLPALAVLTFLLSLAGAFPAGWVERGYSRAVFPTISHILSLPADAAPFSWLDPAVMTALALLIYGIRRRRWWLLLGVLSGAYLWFFWTWGLNYHRPPVEVRLGIAPAAMTPEDTGRFAETVSQELNRLWPLARQPADFDQTAALASGRVRTVMNRIDGGDWRAASRIKRSLIGDGWFRIAGIDGVFNPFGHEPLVAGGLLSPELPFVMSHELAHVRGVSHEGDANLVALLATAASDDPVFQYSGFLQLWLYLRTPGRSALLDPGPREDVLAIIRRSTANQVPLARDVQSAVLDLHLKANRVDDGVRNYSRFLALAMASRDRWQEFR